MSVFTIKRPADERLKLWAVTKDDILIRHFFDDYHGGTEAAHNAAVRWVQGRQPCPPDNSATTPAGMLLHRASRIVEGHRRDGYGQPERVFNVIAEYWTAYLRSIGVLSEDEAIQPHDVCRLMELLKIARGVGMDDCLDAAGYAALAYEVKRDAQPWTDDDEQLAREVGGTD